MSRNKNITEAQRRRMDIITREVGCIPCRFKLGGYNPAECNHLVEGYRLGHDQTVPECQWHHRGICLTGISEKRMRLTFGPSRKLNKKAFRKYFGSDRDLLALTNEYVAAFEANTIGGKNANTAHAK